MGVPKTFVAAMMTMPMLIKKLNMMGTTGSTETQYVACLIVSSSRRTGLERTEAVWRLNIEQESGKTRVSKLAQLAITAYTKRERNSVTYYKLCGMTTAPMIPVMTHKSRPFGDTNP